MVETYDLFTEVVRCAFLGGKQVVNGKNYTLQPTIIRRYDFLRATPAFGSKSEMNRLFSDLPSDLKSTARSELYRTSKGWIEKSYSEKKIKQFQIGEEFFVVPILSEKPAVGIDTSSDQNDTYVCFTFFDNYKAGYHYLEKILQIPKSKTSTPEFKWNKLNPECRDLIGEKLNYILKMSCKFVLVIKTNALKSSDEKLVDVFIKLILGCFTNYDYISSRRIQLRKLLFKLSNEISIHCDADFQPLIPSKIVKQFVRILADGNDYVPSFAVRDSHESEPIQLTDILCGVLKKHIINKNNQILQSWEFHNKLKSKKKERYAKCYFWDNEDKPILT